MSILVSGIILAILSLGSLWRKLQVKLVTDKYQHNLFALRDKLRKDVIMNKIHVDSFLFDYLDQSLSKTIKIRNKINILTLARLEHTHRNNQKLIRFRKKINMHLRENPEYEIYFQEYTKITTNFIKKRHFVSVLGVIPFLLTTSWVKAKVYPIYKNAREFIWINPMSTVSNHYMSPC